MKIIKTVSKQLNLGIKHPLEMNKIDVKSLKKDYKEFIRINRWTWKSQQRFKSARHNVFTEEINKVALTSNDDKRMQLIDSTEIYVYETRKFLVREKKIFNVKI